MDGNKPISADVSGALTKAYEDVLHPSAREVGTAVHRALKLALKPVNGTLWTLEQAMEWVERRAAERLAASGTPPERIQDPTTVVLASVVHGVQWSAGSPELQELFAGLLSTAMDSESAAPVHPAFASVVRQLHPLESRLLNAAATDGKRGVILGFHVSPDSFSDSVGYTEERVPTITEVTGMEIDAVPPHLVNMSRLGLLHYQVDSSPDYWLRGSRTEDFRAMFAYLGGDYAVQHVQPAIKSLIAARGQLDIQVAFVPRFELTDFGERLMRACGVP